MFAMLDLKIQVVNRPANFFLQNEDLTKSKKVLYQSFVFKQENGGVWFKFIRPCLVRMDCSVFMWIIHRV
jgi:hypothetical protein